MFKNTNSKKMTGILLALVLVTSIFIGGSIARYVTSTSSEDEARVAVWGINTGGEEMNLFKNQYKLEDDTIKWWLRTPYTVMSGYFYSVNSVSPANTVCSVIPAFVIG